MGSRRLIRHRAPLDPCGEARATAAAQTGIGDRLHDVAAAHREGVFETGQPSVGDVVLRVDRVGNPHPLVNPAVLFGEVIKLFHRTDKVIGLLVGQAGINLACGDV